MTPSPKLVYVIVIMLISQWPIYFFITVSKIAVLQEEEEASLHEIQGYKKMDINANFLITKNLINK